MKPDLSIITPTGNRQAAFGLCERWMSRQTYTGTVQWLVIDDGNTPTHVTLQRTGWTVRHIRRTRSKGEPRHTLPLNLLAGLELVTGDRIAVVEDDDWYACDYLDSVSDAKADLVGVGPAPMWNLAKQLTNHIDKPSFHPNFLRPRFRPRYGAGLFVTSFTRRLLPMAKRTCRHHAKHEKTHIDGTLWGGWQGSRHIIYHDQPKAIGIKASPLGGRPGQTLAHVTPGGKLPRRDPGLAMLRGLIGEDLDAILGGKAG